LWFSDRGVKIELDQVEVMLEPLAWYQEPDKSKGEDEAEN
jgi:hypothetical protein